MNRLAAMVLAAATLSGAALHAATPNSPIVVTNPTHEKMVGLQLRNDTTAPMKIKAGDTELTLVPGKAVAVKLPEGTQLVAVDATAHYAQGAILATVTPALKDATIVLN